MQTRNRQTPRFCTSSSPVNDGECHSNRKHATRHASVSSYRLLAGFLLLSCCLGQSCDLGPLFGGGFTGGDVLGFHPDQPPSDQPSSGDVTDNPLNPAGDDTATGVLTADAGEALTVMEGQEVILQGSVSGGEGLSLTYLWRQIAGPRVLLMGTSSLTPKFTAPPVLADSVMTFQFTVTAGTTTSSDTIDITVINVLSPKVTLTASPKEGPAPLRVTFTAKSATISPLPEGTYTWDFGDQTATAEGLSVTHTYENGGTYAARLCLTLPPPQSQEPICAEITVTVTGTHTIWYVDDDAKGANDGTSWENAFKTIQAGIDAAGAGDTVQVAAGEYKEYLTIGSTKSNITILGDFNGYDFDNYETTRQDKTNWHTVIDPSESFSPEWRCVDAALGLWSHALAANPALVTIGGRDIACIRSSSMHDPVGSAYCGGGLPCIAENLLRLPSDHLVFVDGASGGQVRFWDGIEAMCGYDQADQLLYLRLRDRSLNPNGLDVRCSARLGNGPRPAVHITGNNIKLRGLRIQGAGRGVLIAGAEAHDNEVSYCYLQNGLSAVMLTTGAHHSAIKANEITWAYYGLDPDGDGQGYEFGAWDGSCQDVSPDSPDYEYAVRHHLYYHLGAKTDDVPLESGGRGIFLLMDGDNNEVSHNHVFSSIRGIASDRSSTPSTTPGQRAAFAAYGANKRIHHNKINNMSSVGISLNGGEVNSQIFENDFDDCNISFRLHDPTVGPIYVYLNRSHAPIETNKHIYQFFSDPAGFSTVDLAGFVHPEIFFYHNSLSGGRHALTVSGYSATFGIKNMYLLNNILNAREPLYAPGPPRTIDNLVFEKNFVRSPLIAAAGDGTLPTATGNIEGAQVWQTYPGHDGSQDLRFFDTVDSRVVSIAKDLSRTPYYGRSAPLPWSRARYSTDLGAIPADGYTVSSKFEQRPLDEGPNEGLLAHWPLNDAARATAESIAGYYLGSVTHGAEWVMGGTELEFGPPSQGTVFVDGDSLALLDDGDGTKDAQATVAFWTWGNKHCLRPEDGQMHPYNGDALHLRQDGSRGSGMYRNDAIRVQFWPHRQDSDWLVRAIAYMGTNPSNGAYDYIAFDLPEAQHLSNWNHWAVTKSVNAQGTGTMRLYHNGMQVASKSVITVPWIVNKGVAKLMGLAIGSDNEGGSTFDGRISDVRFYVRELTGEEIRGLYSAGRD